MIIEKKPENDDIVLLGEYRMKRGKYCAHRFGKEVNVEQREVTCKECGAKLDAFDCLAELAQKHTSLMQERQMLDREVKERRDRIAELKREESNLRARVKRLRGHPIGPKAIEES